MSQGHRRLAAIMFTDMVGYTALGQRNEALSLVLVEEQRKLVRPIFASHSGREVKTMGDAFLVEFPNALDAVRCAYDIQRTSKEVNISLPAESRIHLRIGVHLGDVVESGGDISGDAVNIASRIEPLAEDGGVCVSREVYEQVENKIGLQMVSLGEKSLKNVVRPVVVYKISMPWQARGEPEAYDTLRVAVLPFLNISPDPNDEYFADGLTEELIDRLCQLRALEVIARTSVMNYKKKEKNVVEIGKELRAGSLVEGSVRKAGDRIRVTAQLINSNNQAHLWSSRYDRQLDDVFAVQTDIAERVADALRVQLLPSEREAVESKATDSNEAHTLFLKGRYFFSERTRNGTDTAVNYFREAINRDPSFALPHASLADCYLIYDDYGWKSPSECYSNAMAQAKKAIELDPRLAEPHAALGMQVATHDYDWNRALAEFKLALELNPSYATAYHWRSLMFRYLRKFNESYEDINRASHLDPLSKVIGLNVGEVLLGKGKISESIQQFKIVIEANSDYAYAHRDLGWAYYLASRQGEALDEMRKAVSLSEEDSFHKAGLAYLLGLLGMRDEAAKIATDLEALSRQAYVSKVVVGLASLGGGRIEEGYAYLEMACDERTENLLDLAWVPWMEPMRKDPRWAAIEKRFGFPV